MTKLMTRYRLHSTLEEMVADPEGEYVRYEDYAALQAAYDQMVRHHLRVHNVPVAEPRALPPGFFRCGFCQAEAPDGRHVCGDEYSRAVVNRGAEPT